VGLVIGLGLSAGFNVQIAPKADKTGLSSVTSSASIPESPFVGVVDKALPAVVFIDVRKGVSRGTSDDGSGGGDEGEEWFHRFFNDQPRRQQRIPSSGSGFIVDTDGHILTNNHVVSNAEDITVTLNDKRTFKAKVVGADPGTDVAVIKIEGTKLPVAAARGLGQDARRGLGDRDRQPAGSAAWLGDRGHHQRHWSVEPQHLRRHSRLPGLHPDRRLDQFRQLRRSAVQHPR
jgi:S1-C subfamily serine protease